MENEYVIINQYWGSNEYRDRVFSSSSSSGVSNRLDSLEQAVEKLIAENERLKKIMETPSWEEVKVIVEKR